MIRIMPISVIRRGITPMLSRTVAAMSKPMSVSLESLMVVIIPPARRTGPKSVSVRD